MERYEYVANLIYFCVWHDLISPNIKDYVLKITVFKCAFFTPFLERERYGITRVTDDVILSIFLFIFICLPNYLFLIIIFIIIIILCACVCVLPAFISIGYYTGMYA